MKEEIINLLGKNHTIPIFFNVLDGFYGLYTYKGGVYVFKDGEDIDYDDIDEKDKISLLDVVLSKNWKLNKSLQ